MFKLNPSRCTECQICMQVCSWQHFTENSPKRSRIRLEAEWPEEPRILVCLACKEHECVKACPTGALQWDGWVRVKENLCDGCLACAEACPVDGIRKDPRGIVPLVCDTCQGSFQCAKWCPTGAIQRR